MKDNFSTQASLYARFRPAYPPELIRQLSDLAPARSAAWDCGTGNGQVALQLAEYFEQVYATDISEKQLGQAPPHPRIRYALEPAEHCSAPDRAFGLIVVAQAIHWFHFDLFYAQVRRVLKPGGVLAVVGYGLFRTDSPAVDHVIHQRFYKEITEPYWDPERRYLDEEYRTIPFPFDEIPMPEFSMRYRWTLPDVLGYLNTWSAVQQKRIEAELLEAWGGVGERAINTPLYLRAGRFGP
ncbi:MAG: class I SAM-dependent methyltransferase [Thermoanaerobaculia bacterium]|nr:class I SAM-dependent methyltransferase [Thermoanaerobaculia bacterium]